MEELPSPVAAADVVEELPSPAADVVEELSSPAAADVVEELLLLPAADVVHSCQPEKKSSRLLQKTLFS